MLPSEFYNKNLAKRKPYEDRAINIAKISLPYMIRASGSSSTNTMDSTASQSFNGGLINNLKAKMGMALLPPSTSSFRLKPDAVGMLQLFGGNEDAIAQLTQELSLKTDSINSEIEVQQIRSDMFDALTQLIGVGSVVIEKVKKKGILLYPLKSFVVKLDSKGNPLTICVQEKTSVLPKNITPKEEKEDYELYTMLNYDKDSDKWLMTQDIDGELVGEEKSYKDYDSLPFRYFGWNWMVGEDYHRPFAEDYYPDMNQVDKLAKLNTDGAIIAAKSLVLVNPRGGRTRKQDVNDSDNGAIIDGSAEDVTAFQFGKNYDFQVSNGREAEIKKQLQKAFLDTGSVTRDAERVTAEEIRVMAQQLEASTLAGVYSKMSLSWSKWIVERIMDELGIKFEAIEVSVLTGLDALGRSAEAQKQDAFVQRLAAVDLKHWLKESELISRWAGFDGINTVNLVKTPEEVSKEMQAQQQAAQQQALAQAGAESAGKAGGEAIVNSMQGGQNG